MQCEVCHGPGSTHVAAEGLEEPLAVQRETPASTCTGCHTEQHSDTFQYDAYLRDILGPGHGATARKKLGDGPTGPHAAQRGARAGEAGRPGPGCGDATQTDARPVSSWSSRSGSMLPPLTTTTVRRPRMRLASSSRTASAGAAEASHRMPSVR